MPPQTIDYPDGVTCVDTEQLRPGVAACYLVQSGDEFAFVECGTSLSVPGLLQVLEDRGIDRDQVTYVMPTHVHLDHAGGAGLLMRECRRAQLVIHPRGAKHMADPSMLVAGASGVYGQDNMFRMYGEILPVPTDRMIIADDGFELDFGGRGLRFMDSPGHARHHYAIWDARSRGWFTGDTFGISYREFDGPQGPYIFPTTTPVQFEPDVWLDTLQRFMQADPAWMYLTHYGRVGDVSRLAADLGSGIAMYRSIALHLADCPDRHEQIRDALALHAEEELHAMGGALPDEKIRELLAMDMELNAKGLGVWLDRQRMAVAATA